MPSTYEPIATQTLLSDAGQITFNSIPSTYTDLILVCSVRVTTATDDFNIQFNGDTSSSNYSFTQLFGNGSSAYSSRYQNSNKFRLADYMPNGSSYGIIVSNIMSYANPNVYKTTVSKWSETNGATGINIGLWRDTSAITSIRLTEGSTQNIKAGSTFTLYGVLAA